MPLAIEAQQIPAEETTLTLAVRYADGRIVHHVAGQNPGSAWTPMFPRVVGWQPAPGDREVAALKFVWSRFEDGAQVKVSVLRGRPHQEETPVATVHVRPTGTVVVDAVRKFGVETVQFSLSTAPRVAAEIPRTISAVAGIVVLAVEAPQGGAPRYQVTVQNRSAANVRAFTIEAYRSGRLSLSGRRAGMEGRPMIEAGGTCTFDVAIRMLTGSNSTPVPRMLDEIKISSAVWSDGSIDGDVKKALETVASDFGNSLALAAIAESHRQAVTDATADPRAALDHLQARLNAISIEPGDETVTVARQ